MGYCDIFFECRLALEDGPLANIIRGIFYSDEPQLYDAILSWLSVSISLVEPVSNISVVELNSKPRIPHKSDCYVPDQENSLKFHSDNLMNSLLHCFFYTVFRNIGGLC